MSMIEWAAQYLDVANDGFKAELLWWKWATGSDAELPLMAFPTPEGKYYASFFDPVRYALPESDEGAETGSEYSALHLAACKALHAGAPVPLSLSTGDSHSESVHKILWASGFGQWAVIAATPVIVLAGLDSSDDNEHAMSVLAMRLLGHDVSVRAGIVDLELSPLNYHAVLVAQVCAYLPKNGA